MKKKIIVIGIIVAVLLLGVAIASLLTEGLEPEYEGRAFEIGETSPDGEFRLIFQEEFEGEDIDRHIWSFYHGFLPQNRAGLFHTNRNENAVVRDGNLVLIARAEEFLSEHDEVALYTSAGIHSTENLALRHGKVDIRAKLPTTEVEAARVLFGLEGVELQRPYKGGFDILEMLGANLSRYNVNAHWTDEERSDELFGEMNMSLPPFERNLYRDINEPLGNEWHVYSLVWNEERVEFLFNGRSIGYFEITDEAMSELHEHMFVFINLSLTMEGETAPLHNGEELTLLVDYIRVWEPIEN